MDILDPLSDSGPGDESLPTLSELVAGLADIGEEAEDAGMRAESVEVDLPVEFYVRPASDGEDDGDDSDGSIECSPPTQYTETSIMPVFHRLKIRIGLEEGTAAPDVVAGELASEIDDLEDSGLETEAARRE